MNHTKRGFSLLELAIALTVIGLIIGGIMVGRQMVHSASLQAVLAEQQKYFDAITQFRDKYQALPGDFSTASDVWSTVGDGDGNGMVPGFGAALAAAPNERYLVWTHLAKAHLIEGEYVGDGSPGGAVGGANVPASKYGNNTTWQFVFNNAAVVNDGILNEHSPAFHGHLFYLSQGDSASGILPADMYEIDSKLDDGKATTGRVGVVQSPDCYTGTEYNVAQNTPGACAMLMETGF